MRLEPLYVWMGKRRLHYAWTRDFISAHGYGEYIQVVWIDTSIYRLKNWRCWFGHALGKTQWSYEWVGMRTEGWRNCERPRCEYCEEDRDE